jgi:hypothetical protein
MKQVVFYTLLLVGLPFVILALSFKVAAHVVKTAIR